MRKLPGRYLLLLLPLGALAGAVYGGFVIALARPVSPGPVLFGALFGAFFGLVVGGGAALAGWASARFTTSVLMVACASTAGAGLVWTAVIVWSLSSTSSSLDVATLVVASASAAASGLFVGVVGRIHRRRDEGRAAGSHLGSQPPDVHDVRVKSIRGSDQEAGEPSRLLPRSGSFILGICLLVGGLLIAVPAYLIGWLVPGGPGSPSVWAGLGLAAIGGVLAAINRRRRPVEQEE